MSDRSDLVVQQLRDPQWKEALSAPFALMEEAADIIERLRSVAGKAEVGDGFADIVPRYPAPRDGDPSMND